MSDYAGVSEFVNATLSMLSVALTETTSGSSDVNIGILTALVTSCTCITCLSVLTACRFRRLICGRNGCCDDGGSGSESDSNGHHPPSPISHIALPIVVSQHQSYPEHHRRSHRHRRKGKGRKKEKSSDDSSSSRSSSPSSPSGHHKV